MKSVLRIGLVAALFVGAPTLASASTIAVAAVGAAGNSFCGAGNPLGCNAGFQFSIASGITVTALGVFDQTPAGLAESHQIGIWTDAGVLKVSGTETGADALQSGFRFTTVASTFLAAGTYRIGAIYSSSSPDAYLAGSGGGITFAPGVTWLSDAQGVNGFVNPALLNIGCCTPGLIGPNFKFDSGNTVNQTGADAVPEPATLALVGIGAMLAASRLRRRQ